MKMKKHQCGKDCSEIREWFDVLCELELLSLANLTKLKKVHHLSITPDMVIHHGYLEDDTALPVEAPILPLEKGHKLSRDAVNEYWWQYSSECASLFNLEDRLAEWQSMYVPRYKMVID
jgi:hypothetical protein